MNERARYDDFHTRSHSYPYRLPPSFTQSSTTSSSPDYLTTAGTLLAFVLFACVAYPLLQVPRHLWHGLHNMAARMSFGLLRRPMPGFGSESGATALNSVFGLKSAAANLGTETIQRGYSGIRSIVGSGGQGGSGSDAPAGLGNWDNSCYQNSVIQGLASLKCFPNFLRKVSSKSRPRSVSEKGRGHQEDSDGDATMNEALLATVQRLNDAANGGKALWLPAELKTMSTWQQQDAQEYFSKILDKVDREALKVARLEGENTTKKKELGLADLLSASAPPGPTIENSARAQQLAVAPSKEEAESERERDEEKEILKNPLEGMIAQRVACKSCGHSDGISLIPFNCLTVPLGSAHLYDIRDCLDSYTALEEIDDVQCPKCTLLSFKSKLEGFLAKDTTSEVLKAQLRERLLPVTQLLEEGDLSDEAMKSVNIPKKQWATSTKTKQAVVARAPNGLVIHVNRSMFNEYTGAQIKNPAAVQFPLQFGLAPWTIGKAHQVGKGEVRERWSMDPTESMLPPLEDEDREGMERTGMLGVGAEYELRAVVTHFGRHENGHYVAYRRYAAPSAFSGSPGEVGEDKNEREETWWRLSDEDVTAVDEEFVLRQGGVFMLFYERVDTEVAPLPTTETGIPAAALVPEAVALEVAAEEVPLPELSADEMAFLAAEDEYVLARPLVSWSPPSPIVSPKAGEEKPPHLPTPPPSVVESTLDPEPQPEPAAASSHELEDETVDKVALELNRTTATPSPDPSKVVKRMRTSSLMKDGMGKHKGSSESLRLGGAGRMVSAS